MHRTARFPWSPALLATACAGWAFACSGASNGSGTFDVNGGSDSGTNVPTHDGGIFGGGDTGSFVGDGSSNGPGCSDAAKLIYVLDDAGALHSFDPKLLPSMSAFKTIGTPNCQWGGGGPNSMAIDRSANAWICDNNGGLFKVSTSNASCQTTTFKPGQHNFGKFGMGFSTTTAGGTDDVLYVDGNSTKAGGTDGPGLATIDLTTMKLNPIGAYDAPLTGQDCELTGTGDARLFGFFFSAQSSVAQIDKGTAHIISNQNVPVSVNLTGLGSIAWAFSFYAGSFYLYTADTSQNPYSDVTLYDPMTGKSTTVLSQIGFNIVGAGVSTCAPTQPVK